MRIPTFINAPVFSLQTMLREISFLYPAVPRIIPDGIFGEQTLEAVMVFQRELHPPVTGVVDAGTWDAIVLAYLYAKNARSSPAAVSGFPDQGYTISPGEQSVHLYLIQAMFKALSRFLSGLEECPVNGHCAPAVEHNVRLLQQVSGLPVTGVMDKHTWNVLSHLYHLFVMQAQTPWLSRPQVLAAPPDTPRR